MGLPFRFDGASSQTSKARVAEHRPQEVAERPAGVAAERVVLPLHRRDVVDLELAGGEVVVPDQREPLGERVGR